MITPVRYWSRNGLLLGYGWVERWINAIDRLYIDGPWGIVILFRE